MTEYRAVRVGDISQQIRGVTYSSNEARSTSVDTYLPVLRATNITEHGLNFDELVYIPDSRISERQLLRLGDVVITASSGSLSIVGKAASVTSNFHGSFGAFCKVLRPSALVDPAYFAHFFKTTDYRRRISSAAAGLNINNLRNEDLDELEFPLPPLDEQRRIAAILDQADALRRKRRLVLEKLNTLPRAIFHEMFGDPTAPKHDHSIRYLSEVTSEIYRYPTYFGIEYQESGVPEIRGELINDDGTISLESAGFRYISTATSRRFPRTVLSAGDLIMSVRGTIGKLGIIPSSLSGANITANLIRMSPDRKRVEPLYLFHALHTHGARAQLSACSSSTTISTIKASDLRNMLIVTASLDEQLHFVTRLHAVNRLTATTREQSAKWDQLFASLQHHAFAGTLIPNSAVATLASLKRQSLAPV